ncbi:MAG: DUF1801 domain-containing protein [Daejeonella sp.]
MPEEPDHFYLKQSESIKACLLALREIILSQDKDITAVWRYGMPFFNYKGTRFCYLWVHKKQQRPYIGVVEGNRFDHPLLIAEKRSRMKIMLFDPNEDLPIDIIQHILQQAIHLYKTGEFKLKA